MRIINQWLEQWHFRQLQKKIQHTPSQRKRVSYSEAKSIGVLFNANEMGSLKVVQDFEKALRKKDKSVKALAYCTNKLQRENFPYPTFGKQEVSIAFQPKGKAIEHFIQKPFDILFNLYQQESLPLGYISACSQAHLRIGPANDKTFYYDLMIEMPEGKDLHYFIQQAETILRNVNTDQ